MSFYKTKIKRLLFCLLIFSSGHAFAQRTVTNFNKDWKFFLGNDSGAIGYSYDDTKWRTVNLPHDWSIEGKFSKEYPTTYNEGALPAGIGWYRKTFSVPLTAMGKRIYINFDGVYRDSEVWINGHYLGKRPNGYISFRYELTPYLKFGNEKNVIAVKVDNSEQPNSRWYTGSGIYRKVWLLTTNKIAIDEWGTYVTTSVSKNEHALVNITANIKSDLQKKSPIFLLTKVYDAKGNVVASDQTNKLEIDSQELHISQKLSISTPKLWSTENPVMYKAVSQIILDGRVVDNYEAAFGIRTFYFDAEKGFFLNGKHLKILGVCDHENLGALGAAVNKRAIERQLEILKAMGCNAIRTAHNPPSVELLNLCDKMGFIVMDEAFDMWMKEKNKKDYHLDFAKWHKQDLQDMIKRDRNHPSIFIWSIGNEIREQFDSSGISLAKELAGIVKALDTTRPVTCALTENDPHKNFIYQSGALDLLGFNYKINDYPDLPHKFPGQKIIASETMSALATRGHYDMPSDSIRFWPPGPKGKFIGNPDLTVSAYDNVCAYWGSTHEEGWNAVKKYDFISGLFVWSGFDFLGEPVPYSWPARSSYYGIIDLAGFPKDSYYMYQSEWTDKPVLHIFPHWNWPRGKVVDVWAYFNNADEVELFLNGKSLGIKKKQGDSLHVMWRIPFEPGTLKAVSRLKGKTILTREIKTAGKPAKIMLTADRNTIKADGTDLSFVTVKILDAEGNLVPDADNLVNFTLKGEGFIAGVDNGLQTSMKPFKANYRKAFNGLCLAIIQSKEKTGQVLLKATSPGLKSAEMTIKVKR